MKSKAFLLILAVILLPGCKQKAKDDKCSFDKFLEDKNTTPLAKTIYKKEDWNLNDFQVLSFLDSLTARDKEARPFYFRVVTNSKEKSDGYYSEALGLAGKDYVEHNSKEFAAYFDEGSCFTEKDLETWSDIVMLEFGILVENTDNPNEMKDYIQSIREGCQDCSVAQKATIEKFAARLNAKWQQLLNELKQQPNE